MHFRPPHHRLAHGLLTAALLLAAPGMARAQSSPPKADLGDFQHHERRDADGADRSLVVTTSEDGLLVLGWQCTPTGMRTLLALGWRWVGNEDDDIMVAYRFPDDDAVSPTLWRLGGTGTVAWMRIGEIAAFTDAALAADSVAMNLSDPFDGESRETTFGLRGFDAALQLLGCDPRRPSEPGQTSPRAGR